MTEISQSNSINISVSVNAIRYKIIFVGDAGVGKTTIINRINDNEFQSAYDATIGVDFWPKKINFRGNEITLQIWDTAGQERYRGLIPSYVRNSSIVFIVFDITNRKTFESIPKWIELIKSIEKNTLVLIGNKDDLEEKREVKKKEGEDLAKENEIAYYELSAKRDNNNDIKKIFFNTVIELPTFSGYIDNKEKEGLIDELIQENKENKKDYLNINVKKENMLTIHNDKDNNNNNNNNNNRANEIDRYNRANKIDRYIINYTDSSLKIFSEIRNDNTNSARKRGICSC